MLSLRYIAAALAAGLCAAGAASPIMERAEGSLPQFVLDYDFRGDKLRDWLTNLSAPIVYLDKQEKYFPSDIGAQLLHTHPTINNGTPVAGAPQPLTLDNLDQLNNLGGNKVYLSSNDDFSKGPAWLNGVKPDANGKTNDAKSCAIIVRDYNNGTVDAFYMYFYAFNQGDIIGPDELGDHVGDWEHNMIRFVNGVPKQVWYSQHANGEAFYWFSAPKKGKRLVTYSGRGTHAQWATNGTHDHTIPNVVSPVGVVIDFTSQGLLWDPTLSAYAYSVSFPANTTGDAGALNANPTFTAYNGQDPVNWLYYVGQWGDDQLPDTDPRQMHLLSFRKYVGGPTGPRDKQLNRVKVCPDSNTPCIIRTLILPGA